MKVLMYSVSDYERSYLVEVNEEAISTDITTVPVSASTAKMAGGYDIVSVSGNDKLDAETLKALLECGIRFVTIRSAEVEHVDLTAAEKAGITIAAVPHYAPFPVAEHAVALMLALNRKLVLANTQVRNYNFALDELIGFNLHGKKVGIIGMGRVGRTVARILDGFGCQVLGFDLKPDPDLCHAISLTFTDLDTICREADIITLHVSLNEHTKHLIDSQRIALMKKGVMLINTSRGKVVHTEDVLKGLEEGKIGYFGADVYEQENNLFAHDYSNNLLKADALLNRFLELPNVIITPHQSYATHETLRDIANATYYNIECFARQVPCSNEIFER